MTKPKKSPAAVILGRLGGAKNLENGGRERFVKLGKDSWKNRPKPTHPKEYYQELRRKSGEAKMRKKQELAKARAEENKAVHGLEESQ